MSFQVAIPTFNRPKQIMSGPLAYLDRCGFPRDRVTIWISGETQAYLYDGLPAHWKSRFRVGAKGLVPNRVAAEATYDEGTRLLWLNDDVRGVKQLVIDGRKRSLVEADINELGAAGFAACTAPAHLWGIYAVNHRLYMAAKMHRSLMYVSGCFYGVILRRGLPQLNPVFGDAKEDYERALRFYSNDGAILRMDNYCPMTTYYNSPEIFSGTEKVETNIRCLEECWPKWIKRNTRKKSPYPEMNISDKWNSVSPDT